VAGEPLLDREARDRGAATSLTVVLLTPAFVVLAFAALQAALWSHARTQARVIARDTAALVARGGVTADDAAASARRVLAVDTDLRHIDVAVTESSTVVRVTVTGDAPGIVRGTRSDVSVTAAVPVEGWVP
jgi:uncharacterized membrane protein